MYPRSFSSVGFGLRNWNYRTEKDKKGQKSQRHHLGPLCWQNSWSHHHGPLLVEQATVSPGWLVVLMEGGEFAVVVRLRGEADIIRELGIPH